MIFQIYFYLLLMKCSISINVLVNYSEIKIYSKFQHLQFESWKRQLQGTLYLNLFFFEAKVKNMIQLRTYFDLISKRKVTYFRTALISKKPNCVVNLDRRVIKNSTIFSWKWSKRIRKVIKEIIAAKLN